MTDDRIRCTVRLESKRFYNPNSNFGIVKASIIEVEEGEPQTDQTGCLILKGEMAEPKIGGKYLVSAIEVNDSKWGIQYDIINMCTRLALEEDDEQGKREYLETIFTSNQVESMYAALSNPYQTFLDGDVESLVTVKGCGLKTAAKWLGKFKAHLALSRIYVELKEYEISFKMALRLFEHYGSSDLVIDIVKKNPYTLMDVGGVGWKKCDDLALKGGLGVYCKERVVAYIKYYLSSMAEMGFTFVYSDSQLLDSIITELGEEIPDEAIMNGIKCLGDKLWWSEDKEKVGLSQYIKLEQKIADELLRIKKGTNNFDYKDWEKIVKQKENEQGWEYTDQQWEGIKTVLENQVAIITGYAGTGKSTVVSAMIEVLKKYSFVQCALAGRAAARMFEITHKEGYTIHRLLGFPKGTDENQKFLFHQQNPLDYDIIILDEISMVDGRLFYYLLRAIPTGAKLIMLGDVGQLESIGCSNIAHDLIKSPEIKSIELNKIHRQAAASAIITESIKARSGIQIIENGWVGTVTKGQLQDLTYDCYSDAGNTFYKTMQYVSSLLADKIDILNFQVIVPIKEKDAGTWNLNSAIQELYNPSDNSKPELFVHYEKNHSGFLRVGDKVINTKNNYKSRSYENQWELSRDDAKEVGVLTPVYNGSIGVITKLNLEREEVVVDFMGIGEVLIERGNLNSLLLGYAITCHKLQGSECDYVIFAMDFGAYSLLTREMVYTAITRAKKHCYLVAQNGALRYAINQNGVSSKQTILQEALHDKAHPKLVF